tara:strand:+ start:3959 stop:4870 length:912 start_codon:yes stop_codon:yes gene_type:complete
MIKLKKMNSSIINFLKILLVIFVFYFLYQNNHLNLESLISFRGNFVLNLFLIFLVLTTLLIGTYRWFLILRFSKIKINFLEVLKIMYICSFYNNFMFGNIGGDVLRVFYSYKFSKKNKIKNAFTIFVDRFFGFIGLTCLGLFSYSIILINKTEYDILIFLLVSFFIFLIIIIFFIKFFKKNKKFLNLLNFLNLNKKLFFIGVIISILLFFTVHLTIYFISNYVYEFNIQLNYIFFANFISSLVGSIPITPGGMGLSEAAFVFVNNSILKIYLNNLANILIYYRLVIFIFSIPSIYFFFRYKRK